MHLKYRSDIDGLRAIAVLSVVIFHYFPSILPGGFVGVDIFFVISGYLITSIILRNASNNEFSFLDFYKRRVLRIFPALLTILVFCLVVGWVFLFQDDYKSIGKHVFSGAFFISNLTLWNESGYFDSQSYLKPLLHLWSLGIEEQFYIVWPLVILACFRFRETPKRLFFSCAVIFIISYTYSVITMNSADGVNYYSPASRFWELMVGAIVAVLKFNGIKTSISKFMPLAGLVIIAGSLFFINEKMNFPGYIAVFPVFGAAIIVAYDGNRALGNRILSIKPLVCVGIVSYPFYLWHWPLYSFYRSVFADAPDVRILILMMALSLLLATLTYYLIEKPIRFGEHKKISSICLSAGVFSTGFAGIIIFLMQGVADRPVNKTAGEYASVTDVYEYYKYGELMRSGVCHSVEIKIAIENGCIKKGDKNIFIIGDSYAAALYNGLDKYIKSKNNGYVISQMTDGNAPPLFVRGKDDLHRDVIDINNKRLNQIKNVQPSIVLISWSVLGANGIHNKEESIKYIGETIKKIREVSSDSRIVVVGPVPEWNDNLIKILSMYYKKEKKTPPVYMSYGLKSSLKEWDNYFANHITDYNAIYISAWKALCNDSGCLTRDGDGPKNVTAVDWGHLTRPGSEFLFNNVGDMIFR